MRTIGALALAASLTGCAVFPDPHHEGGRSRISLPEPEGPQDEETVTVPKSTLEDLKRIVQELDEEKDKPLGKTRAMLFGGGIRWIHGGKLRRVLEGKDSLLAFRYYTNNPVGDESALGPYFIVEKFRANVKHSEMYWDGGSWGGGLRYVFTYTESGGNTYIQADASYVHWQGKEDDRITHPRFDRSLFHRKNATDLHPRDMYGYMLGAGVGASLFQGWLTTEWNYRYQDGTKGYTAHWIEWILGAHFRW